MRTLKDLVDRLNRGHQLNDNFRTSGNRESDYSIDLNRNEIILFSLKDRTYSFTSYISWVNDKDQDLIVNYLANHTPDDWFEEKKYNIIIGKDSHSPIYAAYKKPTDNEYIVSSHVFKDELINDDELQFTEQDIKKLKECLPDYLNKIIDLGKVEVKDLWRH